MTLTLQSVTVGVFCYLMVNGHNHLLALFEHCRLDRMHVIKHAETADTAFNYASVHHQLLII